MVAMKARSGGSIVSGDDIHCVHVRDEVTDLLGARTERACERLRVTRVNRCHVRTRGDGRGSMLT